MRAMATWAVLATLTHAVPAAAAPADLTGAGALLDGHQIFYAEKARHWDEVGVALPSADRLKAIVPFADARFARVSYECAGLSKAGRLTGCKTTVEPVQQGYEAAAAKILKELRITDRPPASYSAPIAQVWVQMTLFNTARPASSGPCWPPSCIAVPAPPPPPPPHGK